MLAKGAVELHDVAVALLLVGEHLGAGKGQHGARGAPLNARDLHQRVNQHRTLVALVLHNLRAPVLVRNSKRRRVLLVEALGAVVPAALH